MRFFLSPLFHYNKCGYHSSSFSTLSSRRGLTRNDYIDLSAEQRRQPLRSFPSPLVLMCYISR
ncbi:MAG: hypothetical protein ACKESB_02575 [Candidatus Hodgkinia cicadicola]